MNNVKNEKKGQKLEKTEKPEKRQKPEKCQNHTKSPLLTYIEAGFAGLPFNFGVQESKWILL